MNAKLRASVAAAVVAFALTSPARAQNAKVADGLFVEGRALMEKGDLASACPKLAESQRLDPSSGTLLNLALCHLKQGKNATAWAEYKQAADLARRQKKVEREKEAVARAGELEAMLSYMTIQVPSPVPGLEIESNGEKVEDAALGLKRPQDPGKYVIVAKAPGYAPATLEINLGGSRDDQVAKIPLLAKLAPVGPIAPEPAQVAPPDEGGKKLKPLPFIVAGAGVAAIGVGATFGILALGSYGGAKDACPTQTNCSVAALDKRSSANTQANVSNIAIGVGVAAVATGAVLFILGRRSGAKPAQAWIAPSSRRPDALEVQF